MDTQARVWLCVELGQRTPRETNMDKYGKLKIATPGFPKLVGIYNNLTLAPRLRDFAVAVISLFTPHPYLSGQMPITGYEESKCYLSFPQIHRHNSATFRSWATKGSPHSSN